MRFAAAAAQEFDAPSDAAQARGRRSMGSKGRDAPACDSRGGEARQLLLGDRPPAPQRKGRHARGLGRELQATGCGQAEACHLTDNGGKAFLAQALFHGAQHVALMKGLGVDDTIGVQARIHETGSEQIAPAEAPENRALQARGDAGGEEGRRAGKLGGRTGLDHLVQGPEGKAALGQMLIDGSNGEGQRPAFVAPAFQALDLVPQVGKHRLSPGTHAPCPTCPSFQDVPSMFWFASESI